MHATLHQLRVFEMVARHQSFSRASEAMLLTQPTVSMQVKHLADIVGLPLFEQTGRKIHLTPAGEALYQTCQIMFASWEQFETTIALMKQPVTVGAPMLVPAQDVV
jgi:DNA-binding transcriptional LysR family regulator